MIIKVILLFLLGTAMSSDLFMNKLKPSAYEVVVSGFKPSGCPMGADLAPLICKLMQTNMNLYYKPQLITPSTYIPQLIVEKCEAPEIKVDLELPATIGEEKTVLIPQLPELPPITIPKFPVPVITEELPEKIREPSDKLEMPLFHIPKLPQLPALEMPVIPEIIDHPEPYSKEGILEIDYNSIEEKPIHIPEPPKLPAFNMPEFPVHVEIPSGPVLPAMDLPAPPMIPEKPDGGSFVNEKVISPEIDYNLVNFEPVSIPRAPLLEPAFVMPEVPAIPTYFQEKPAAFSPISAHFRPLATLPAPPELPPFILTELPMDFSQSIVVKEDTIEKQCEKEETLKSDFHLAAYQRVPQPPELPAFVMPELSLTFEQKPIETYFKPIAPLSPASELPPVSLPEFPVNVVIPSSPVLSPIDFSKPIVVNEDTIEEPRQKEETSKFEIESAAYQHVVVQQPPELPAFVILEHPSLSFEQEPIKTYFEPFAPLPPAPELPPVSLPEFPVNVVIPSSPVLSPIDFSQPIVVKEQPNEEPRQKEETAKFEIDSAAYQHVVVPQPPELPAFVMPELPSLSFEQEPIKTYFEPFAPLPPAPELPPVSLPDFPVNVVIPSSPVLSPIDFSQPIVVKEQPNEEPRQKEETSKFEIDSAAYQHVVVPQPPELPAFILPELPSLSFEQEPIKTYFEPLAPLPPAPELPALSLPEFPVNYAIPSTPVVPAIDILSPPMIAEQPLPEIDYNIINSAPISIAAPPELPAFIMPELPVKVEDLPKVTEASELPSVPKWPQFKPDFTAILPTFINKPCETSGKLEMDFSALANPYFERYLNDKIKESHNILIPTKPMNPEFVPSPCVYNLVMQHVLPNIASDDHFRSWEKTKALTPSFIPCA